MATNSSGSSKAGWWILAIVVGWIILAANQGESAPTPTAPASNQTGSTSGATGNSSGYDSSGYDSSGYDSSGYDSSGYEHGGYENPAPGDDGTADCPPGGGPVYVGSSDPNGYDGDGDGWGCE
jgi:hypothetical protein